MTLRGGSIPSCAACRYRRRKCTATCTLAKYFPAHKPELFQYVHRLYGVANVTKILNTLETEDLKDDAMKSIIFESEWRHRFPAHGCSVIINQLASKLEDARYELRSVKAWLAAISNQSNQRVDHNSCYWPSSHQEFGGNRPRIDTQNVEGTGSVPVQYFSLNGDGGIYAESPENVARPVLGLDLRSDVTSTHNLLSTHLEAQTSVHGIQREPETFFPDYGGLHSDVTRTHNFIPTHLEAQTSVHGIQRETETFFPDYGVRHSDVTSTHNLIPTHPEAQTSVRGIQREPETFFPDYGGLHSDVTSTHNLVPTHLEAQTSVHGMQRETETFVPDYGGLPSDVTSTHNLVSTHLEAQTSVHGMQRETETFFPDYGGLRYSTTADDRQTYIEACEPSSKSSPINDQSGE